MNKNVRTILTAIVLAIDIASIFGTESNASAMSLAKVKTDYAAPLGIDVTDEMNSKPGMYGRLYIPQLEISDAIYYVNTHTLEDAAMAQEVVDAEDSGSYFVYEGIPVIGDHNYQGFYKLITPEIVGMYAHIIRGNTEDIYCCTATDFHGINTGHSLIASNGMDASATAPSGTDMIMITCLKDNSGIAIFYWDKIN